MTFAEVVRLTPDYVPYWKGETYWPIVWKLVPRIIYPDKPMEVSGQLFGHRYGFLSPDDFVTSYNLPQLVEFYANFGWAGVLGGMLVLGVFYRLVQGMFVHPRMGLGATVGVLYLSLKLLLIESSLSGVVGGVAQAVVFLWMVDKGLSIFTLKGAGKKDAFGGRFGIGGVDELGLGADDRAGAVHRGVRPSVQRPAAL
jgi:hypothetical protein